MVAIFTGAGAGFERGSGSVLGKAGLLGSSSLGRGGEQVFVNAANGNMVISRQDEFLVGRGPDVAIARTYNSLADVGDDNNDNWRQSTDRRIFDLTGTVNTVGSTVKRVAGDGSVAIYAWTSAGYVNTDGDGAYDTLSYNSGTWTWTDGDSRIGEAYEAYGSAWRITAQADASGNTLTYTYSGANLTRITSANGEYVDYTWSGSNITSIVTTAGGTLTRTRYSYDGYNRLSTVTVDLSPTDNSVADGNIYTTTYTYYGTSKLVASISQTDGSRVDIVYDSAERVSTFTQTVASGVTRVTSFSYGADYTNITDPAGQVTRLDFASGNMATEIGTWGTSNVTEEAVTIGGAPATKYTLAASTWGAAAQAVSVAAGDTVTFGLTIQGVGSTSTYYLGLYGSGGAGWGANGQSSARIVSGPGQLVQYTGGLWAVTGVSNSQGTRVEFTRTYTQAQDAIAYIYPDLPAEQAGSAIVIADAALLKSAAATTLASMDLANWSYGGVSRASAGTIDGAPAYQYTVQTGSTWSAACTSLVAKAGETITFSLSMQAVGDATMQYVGLYGDNTAWGANASATARIVSGPSTISQNTGGLFLVSGLSTSAATRIEITRHYTQDEAGGAYMYVDHAYGPRPGSALIAAAPHLVKRITEPATARQLVKITTPPPQSGGAAQVVQFAYNARGDLTSVTDALNQTASYTYDANGNLLTSTDRLGNVVTRTYGTKNELLTETRVGSDSSGAANSHTTRYAYDSANRRVYSVTAEGQVTRHWYDSVGQLYWTSEFPDHFYDVSALPASTAITQSQLDTWCGTLSDTTSSPITYTTFDARGNVATLRGYSVPNNFLSANTAEGYSQVNYTYDQAGQLLSRAAAGQNTETFVYDGLGRVIASTDLNGGTTTFVFKDSEMKTEVKVGTHLIQTSTYNKAGELVALARSGDYVTAGTASYQYDRNGRLRVETDATGNKIWHIYDSVGRKLADARSYDGTAALTEYRYDSSDRLVATVDYVGALTSGQVALLNDVATDVQIASVRPTSTYSMDRWSWQVYDSEGRVIEAIDGEGAVTAYSYDGSGRLVRTTGYATRLSSTVIDGFKTAAPATPTLPATHADDSITRSFFDKDGRLIGALDGEGYLSRIVYDKAGRKVEEVAFVAATGTSLRASGTFAQLLSSVGTSTSDRRVRYVYDGQGHLRFIIDSLNQVTGYGYVSTTAGDAHDQVRTTVRYAGTISTLPSYTYTAVKNAIASAGLTSHSSNRTSLSVYDAAGQLAYAIDATGAVTRYSYDSQGQLIKTTQLAALYGSSTLPSKSAMDIWAGGAAGSGDRVTRSYYSDRGELRFTVDAEGYVTRLDYDAEGRLTKEVRWNTAVTVSDTTTIAQVEAALSGTWVDKQYAYHSTGQLSSVTDGEGAVTVYSYYANGNLAFEHRAYGTADVSTTAYSYDKAGRLAIRHDAYGTTEQATTSYAYDAFGNVITITDSAATTTRTYDQLGQLLSESRGGASDSHEYSAFGEVVKTTDRNGNASYRYYDQLGRVTVARDAESYLTETSYTLFGEVASVIRRYNATTATPSTTVVPTAAAHATKDATTSFLYDKLGRVERTIDAEGNIERYWYDAFGGRIQVRNKLGGDTGYGYTKTGRLSYEYVYAPVHDASGNQTASGYYKNYYLYDARGNLNHVIEALGLTERRDTYYTYDKADRLTRIDHPQVLNYDPATGSDVATIPVSTFAYDRRGNQVEAVDANGARTLSYYDDLDRKTVEIDALGTYRSWAYDGVGNVTSEKVYGTQVTLPASSGGSAPNPPSGEVRETVHTYDALNRLKTSSIANVRTGVWNGSAYTSSVGTVTLLSLEYDAQGNVIRRTDGNGAAIYSYYDRRGVKYAEYDQENYLTFWSLDAEGNILSERRYATRLAGTPAPYSVSNPGTSGDDRVTMFEYDRNGRRTKETREATGAWAFTGAGAAIAASSGTAADAVITTHYNALGQVDLRTYSSGETVTSVYDVMGRLIEDYKTGYADHDGASVTPSLSYYYDALGNVTRTVQGVHGGGGATRVTTYSYGAGGRLRTTVSADGTSRTLQYDVVGNLRRDQTEHSRSDGAYLSSNLSYVYDLLGRVTDQLSHDYIGGVGWQWTMPWQTTSYNAYGEVASIAVGGVTQAQNKYDRAGRLWATSAGDGVWKLFGYDGAGHQTAAIASAGYDLTGVSFADALGLVSNANVNATWTVVDKRGQATKTIEEGRQLTASSSAALQRFASYNAFGEVTSETDARGYTTDYRYNSMGRLIEKKSPGVANAAADGTVTTGVRPTENYYYDREGRMIGRDDANGNRTTWRTLAGTGLAGSQGLITHEYHADGGIVATRYDRFGDAREIDNELGQQESRGYDALGRVTSIVRRGGLLTDYYSYDGLGRQLKHWNSMLGSSNAETTDYDALGRVTSSRAFGGDVTGTSYVWSASTPTSGMGTFGGWTETTTYANAKTLVETSDAYGRTTAKTDLGGHGFTYSYDIAGRRTAQSGAFALTYSYYNSGQLAGVTEDSNNYATYSYDANGNKLTEFTKRGGATVQDATATYDALNRLTTWTEAGSSTSPAASLAYEYDLNGNIRHATSTYATLNAAGTATAAGSPKHDWYLYDTMDRVVRDKGQLVSGVITGGTLYSYDAAGRRVTASSSGVSMSQKLWRWRATPQSAYAYYNTVQDFQDGEGGEWQWTFSGTRLETYTYNASGTLASVTETRTLITGNATAGGGVTPTTGGQTLLRGSFSYDAMGRQTGQTDYEVGYESDLSVAFSRSISYNTKGQVTGETTNTRQGTSGNVITSVVANEYDAGSSATYALGAVVKVTADDSLNGGTAVRAVTTNSYAWYDGAVQDYLTYAKTGQSTYTTDYILNGAGQLTKAEIRDGRWRDVTYTNDLAGQVVRRDEQLTIGSSSDPHEIWYRYNGSQLGFTGNNGTLESDYTQSVANRTIVAPATPGGFRNGATSATTSVEFDPSLQQISSYRQGGSGGSYTVRPGDTLQGIAAMLWGNSNLWYKLAEANGIGAQAALTEGRSLAIPAGIQANTHNAATFRPYDAADAIGETSPVNPKPSKKNNQCGAFGAILLTVVAVAVTALLRVPVTSLVTGLLTGSAAAGTAAAATAAAVGTIVGGALAGAGGSIASQSVGLATGIQDKFSFKQVAMAGLSGAAGAGLGQIGGLNGATGLAGIAQDAARGILGNAAVQGVSVITGLQSKFDFAGVAAAGLGGAAAAAIGGATQGLGRFGSGLAANTAGGIANAAVRTLATGGSFGDNLIRALPDVIGSTLGNALAGGLAGTQGGQANAKAALPLSEANVTATGMKPNEIITTGARTLGRNDAVFAEGQDNMTWLDGLQALADIFPDGATVDLAQQFVGRNPRVRMGGNGGPPLYDPRTLQEAVRPLANSPAGPVLGIVDNLLDLSGPANAVIRTLYQAQSRLLIHDIRAINPAWHYMSASPGGPVTSEGMANDLIYLRMERAAQLYNRTGDASLLQLETLRATQRFVDSAYDTAVRRYDRGELSPRLSREEAIGNAMDRDVRTALGIWYNQYGISYAAGRSVEINNRAYASDGSYRVPDARVGNVALDWTLSWKSASTAQVQGFFNASFRPNAVVIVRPSRLGGSYIIPRAGR